MEITNNYIIDRNIKKLSDKKLLEQTEYLVKKERAETVFILWHLREIEIRNLYVDLNYSSMYQYCIKHLKFSEGETQRRLASARLLIELPEIESKIIEGDLNLTNLSQIRSFLNIEKNADNELSHHEKLDLIEFLENKSTREVKKDLVRFSSKPALMAEKLEVVTSTPVFGEDIIVFKKFEALLDAEGEELLTEFKDLFAHELNDFSDGSILTFLLEKAVQQKKKKLGLIEKESESVKQTGANPNAPLPSAKEVKPLPQRSHIPTEIKRAIWVRANSCCEHRDIESQIQCNSKHALEIDHITPVALGGTNDLENLQLLCRNHNSRRAIKTFGIHGHDT